VALPFRNPPETNYRALRNMGLAAWWGGSLGTLASLMGAARSQKDPVDHFRVLNEGLTASRGLQAGAVTAYLLGTTLVHFGPKPLGDNYVPRWITEGVEDKARSLVTAGALAAAVGAKQLRAKEGELHESGPDQGGGDKAESLRTQARVLHALVPSLTGWLMYSHLKQDMRETQGRGGILRRLLRR